MKREVGASYPSADLMAALEIELPNWFVCHFISRSIMTCMMLLPKAFSFTMTIFEARSSALTASKIAIFVSLYGVKEKGFSYVPSQNGRSVSMHRVGYTTSTFSTDTTE